MRHIQTFNQIDQLGLDLLQQQNYKLSEQDSEAIILRSKKLEINDINPSVQVIARAGAGVNNIPLPELTAKGIPVLNTPGANANAVKELVIAAMLICKRNLMPAYSYAQLAQAQNLAAAEIEAAKKQFIGNELSGNTLAIIGLGSIGVQLANSAIAIGLDVIGYDPHINIENSWQLSANVRRADTLAECIKTADFISLHIPLLEATRNIINTEVLNNCKNGAVLLNFARSELVDSAAISSALSSKKIAFYACDFPSSSWQDNQQVISFPHLGASTNQATSNCAVMAAKQIISFLEHGSIINSVNFPQLHLDPVKIARITIANDNIPSMVSQISNCLSANNLNISALYNRSRGDIAYTAIDLEHAVDAATIKQIRTIPGIRNLRYLEAEQCV